ncbi:proline-rich extensin-like protein EPR1 [Daphnia pulex]|uniref:proline-rich extensin-like protein EPR1 n=1 Tax=Daphnia pulex TaxID=6669 RepID=UPI001EDFD80B|nr:proline-rich extensin-like protein EPR1 [Daphnia pulex]
MARCRILKLHTFLLALTIVLTMADEDRSNKSAERKDVMRTARCEHHDHDEKPPSKWLAKFKKTKLYGPSKSQHRQKTHYGQPQAHIRPPPQYVRTQTNYNIPSFHPPAIPPPTYNPHLHSSNPNYVLPQHSYSPVKIYSSPPQVQSFNPPAQHLPLAPTEAPPYPQDPEDFEGYSLHALVHNPLVPHSQVPVSPVNLYGYPSQEQNFNLPAQHSLLVSTEAPILSTYYSNAPSHQDLGDPKDYSSPTPVINNHPPVPLFSVTNTHDGYPSQAQNFNLPPDSSTDAPVPSTHTNTPYRQDPVEPEIPTVPVNNPSASYSPSQVPVSPASYVPPSPNHLEIRDPDPPAITPPVSTEATVNQTSSYAGSYGIPTTTPYSQDAAKTEKVPYSSRRPSRRPSKAPTYAPSTYSSPVTTERTAYTSPSYSDFENPPVSSTPVFYPSPATTSYDPSTYTPPVTEAPAYFPHYFGDDFDAHSFDDPDPEPEPLGKPTFFPSYDDSPFSYNNPSFFEDSQNVSPPVYSEEPFRKANSRPSAEIPDYYSNEDEKDDAWKDDEEEEFFQQQGKFPRFDEFVKQMMSIGRK